MNTHLTEAVHPDWEEIRMQGDKEYGTALRILRLSLGMTQQQLSVALGYDTAKVISDAELGRSLRAEEFLEQIKNRIVRTTERRLRRRTNQGPSMPVTLYVDVLGKSLAKPEYSYYDDEMYRPKLSGHNPRYTASYQWQNSWYGMPVNIQSELYRGVIINGEED